MSRGVLSSAKVVEGLKEERRPDPARQGPQADLNHRTAAVRDEYRYDSDLSRPRHRLLSPAPGCLAREFEIRRVALCPLRRKTRRFHWHPILGDELLISLVNLVILPPRGVLLVNLEEGVPGADAYCGNCGVVCCRHKTYKMLLPQVVVEACFHG